MIMTIKPFKIRRDELHSTCNTCSHKLKLYHVIGPSAGEFPGARYGRELTKDQAEVFQEALNLAFEEGADFQHQKEWRRRHGKK